MSAPGAPIISLHELRRFKRVGILGGSFDPVHQAHLDLASKALLKHHLDCVVFVPAKQNPLKERAPHASDRERLELLAAALADKPAFFISDIELARVGERSFTVETLREFRHALLPQTQLFLLLGMDALRDFLKWKNASEIVALAQIVPVYRSGVDLRESEEILVSIEQALSVKLRPHLVDEEPPPYSSTALRSKIAAEGADRLKELPPGVADIISSRGIYSK